jgi:aldehyde:ferredoxin oxidoreductase
MIDGDPLSRVLHIDLSRRRFWVVDRRDLFEKYVGGAGVAINLLIDECPRGRDPFDPENPMIFVVGPLTGVFPIASKTVAMFKSPHNDNLGESHAGGRSAVAIRMAGYGAIIVKGASATPVYLVVESNRVHFRDASALWGMTSFTTGRAIREKEPGAGIRTIMRIGRAGERLVSFACVMTETYRHFGRLGLGAIFGSKKLKAIMVSGKRSLKVSDMTQYRKLYNEIFESLVKSPAMKKYHDLGTAMNVSALSELGAFPTRNLEKARFESAEEISGERFAEKHLGRRIACAHCPVSCIHLAALREPYEAERYFYKTRMVCYDYEPIYALGSMIGVSSTEGLLRLFDEVEALGLDAISTGVTLAWATEAQVEGLISDRETAGLKLRWGDHDTYLKALRLIVDQPTDFSKALAKGVDHASSIYGGADFALAFGGNEMPGYHTGPSAYAGYMTGARHSHLDGAGYSLDQRSYASGSGLTADAVAEALLSEESWRQILSSLVICYFGREIYTADTVLKALKLMGYESTPENLLELGGEALKAKYDFKMREGFDFKKLRIPKRILETATPLGLISENFIFDAIQSFASKMRSL